MSSLLSVWADHDTAKIVQAKIKGAAKKEEKMGRSKLSLKNQLRGVEAALKSKKTPPQFRDGLRRRAADLRKKIGEERDGKPTGLTPVLGRLWDIR